MAWGSDASEWAQHEPPASLCLVWRHKVPAKDPLHMPCIQPLKERPSLTPQSDFIALSLGLRVDDLLEDCAWQVIS